MTGEPLVVVTSKFGAVAAAALRARGGLRVVAAEAERLPRGELHRAVAGASAIVAQIFDRLDGALFDAAGTGLRLVVNLAAGADNVDRAAAADRGVLVATTAAAESEAVADHAFALLLAAARRIVPGDRFLRTEGRLPFGEAFTGLDVYGSVLLVVGPGRIGRAVARRAAGFGMRIRYAGRRDHPEIEAESGAERRDLDEGLSEADFVVIAAPLTAETRGLFDERRLARMKPTAVLVNVGRGAIVDEAALVRALRTGALGGAGLDVYEREPFLAEGLVALDTVVLSPHLGAATERTRAAMADLAVENVVAALSGHTPPGLLPPPEAAP